MIQFLIYCPSEVENFLLMSFPRLVRWSLSEVGRRESRNETVEKQFI